MVIENQGIVREGTEDDESVLAWLVWYSFHRGTVTYDDLVAEAQRRRWQRNDLPEMRRTQTAFIKAKDSLQGMSDMAGFGRLERLDGWDGQVSQEMRVNVLQRTQEYQISVKRTGSREGKLHTENHNILRLRWSPPTDFDPGAWRTNHMESAWNDAVERTPLHRLDEIIEVEPYWDSTEVDPMLIQRVSQLVRTTFRREAILVDEQNLKRKVQTIVTRQLRGIPYRQQKSMYAVPRQIEIDGEMRSTLPTIRQVDELIEFFTTHNPLEVDWGDMELPPRERRIRTLPRNTSFNYLQILEGERELRYLRESVVSLERQERAELYDKVLRLAENFNEESAEEFVNRLSAVTEDFQSESMGRISFLPDDDTVFNDIDDQIYAPMTERIGSRINAIREDNETVADALLAAVQFGGLDRINV